MKVAVDDEVCGGHGVCVGLCPEVFDLTDDGFAVVLVDEVPANHQVATREAAIRCPNHAIAIDD